MRAYTRGATEAHHANMTGSEWRLSSHVRCPCGRYNLHRCMQPRVGSHGNYLAQCVAQLDACSHKYSEDIICGSHNQFYVAHGQSLGLEPYVYIRQLESQQRLEALLATDTIYQVRAKTANGDDEPTIAYKYFGGKCPRYISYTGKALTVEEREKYDTGSGDTTVTAYPRKPYSLQSPPPHALFADATAAFLRTHDKVTMHYPQDPHSFPPPHPISPLPHSNSPLFHPNSCPRR